MTPPAPSPLSQDVSLRLGTGRVSPGAPSVLLFARISSCFLASPGPVPLLPRPAAANPEHHRYPVAVLLLLPSAQVRGRAAPPGPGRQGWDVTACPQEPRFRKPCSVLTSGTGGPGALSPLSYPICPADLPSLSGLPKSFPHENWGTEGHSHHPSLKFLLFSISLLGKPPHSSIMSMATGKNLQSIPKKVSNVEPCEPGLFLRNVGMEGAEPWGREVGLGQGEEFHPNFPRPRGRGGTRAGQDPCSLSPGPAH